MHYLFNQFTGYHRITVYDTADLFGEKGKFRVLQFSNDAMQGAMDLRDPERIVFEYPRAIIHLMEVNNPSFEDVFVIGHGIGTIAGHFPEKRFKTAELDSQIVELSRRYFGCRQDHVIVGDGRAILAGERSHAYDYIIVDAFTEKGTPLNLVSREFFSMTQEKLAPSGSVILNLIGKGANDTLINAIHTTLIEVYPFTKSFALPAERGADIKNIILIGGNRPIGFRARQMAGFTETELGEGHLIQDSHRHT